MNRIGANWRAGCYIVHRLLIKSIFNKTVYKGGFPFLYPKIAFDLLHAAWIMHFLLNNWYFKIILTVFITTTCATPGATREDNAYGFSHLRGLVIDWQPKNLVCMTEFCSFNCKIRRLSIKTYMIVCSSIFSHKICPSRFALMDLGPFPGLGFEVGLLMMCPRLNREKGFGRVLGKFHNSRPGGRRSCPVEG